MATKLLLIQDVEDLGRSGEIVNVKDGYARNFLIPRKLGVKADKNALRRQVALQEARLQQAVVDKEDSEKLATSLQNIILEIEVKVDPEGHMYGSVNQADIVRLLKEQQNIELEKKFIVLKQPIKQVGLHNIELRLKEGVLGSFNLRIYPEGADLNAIIEAEKAKIAANTPQETSTEATE